MSVAIKIENVSKLYRLGTVGTGTMAHDLNRWWHTVRGKEDPYAKVGQVNDRTQSSTKNQEPRTKNSSPDYVWALRDINLEVQQGEILGIIGRNGAGKSTLLKLLSRVTAPTQGTIKTKGRIASLLEVGTGFHAELTGRENIYLNGSILGMKSQEITKQLDDIVQFSGCEMYLDTPVKRYSSGMTVRLGFAVAAHLRCEILIVDEVLAVGDFEFQRKCIGKMKDMARLGGRTVLFVSHNTPAIQNLCTKATLLTHGELECEGPTAEIVNRYLSSGANLQSRDVVALSRTHGKPLIKSVWLKDASGRRTDSLIAGSGFEIGITYKLPNEMDGLLFGVGIEDCNGTRVFSLNNEISGDGEFTSKGNGEAAFAFNTPTLNAGHFFVSLSIVRYNEWLDFVERAFSFVVEPSDVFGTGKSLQPAQGVVYFNGRVTHLNH